MDEKIIKKNKKATVSIEAYNSSMKLSYLALGTLCLIECLMLVYSYKNASAYGIYIWQYRFYYLFLLCLSLIGIGLNTFVIKNIEKRYEVLVYSYPFLTALFFLWSLAVTNSDMKVTGEFNPMVFMTFTLTISLSFYMNPYVFATIAFIADIMLFSLGMSLRGFTDSLLNIVFFMVIQLILGTVFLYNRTRLAERVVRENENASFDVMTGFYNRRVYETDLKNFNAHPPKGNVFYIAMDINGLKTVNDTYGHDAGDKHIISASQCIRNCFDKEAKHYRIGGDEFIVITHASEAELKDMLSCFDKRVEACSEGGDVPLSISYGYVASDDFPSKDFNEIAIAADRRMYEAKHVYYQENGTSRHGR